MKSCIVCGGDFYNKPLLSYKNMPALAQNIPTKEQLADERGMDFNLCQCSLCGLVQLDCEAVFYYKDVIRAGGFTSVMLSTRREQYRDFIEKFSMTGKRFLEVGCGQGEFLQILTEFDVKAFGIENNQELVELATQKGLSVTKNFIGSKADIVRGEKFDAFLIFNFLEHQPDPNGMLAGIYNNLTEDGMGIVTVPSFEYIVENNSYYEFIRDHIAYYTEDTLRFLLEKNGFSVAEFGRINRDTIYAYVKKKQKIDLTGLEDNFNKLNTQIKGYVQQFKQKNGTVAMWGASHQGFTILSTARLDNDIDYIIDSAPFKQGKYSPATHIPIVSPDYFFEKRADAIIIVAPAYSDEIYKIITKKYGSDVYVAALRSKNLEALN